MDGGLVMNKYNISDTVPDIMSIDTFRDYCKSLISKYGYRMRSFPVLAIIEKCTVNIVPGNEFAIRAQYNIARWINVSLNEGFIETEITFDPGYMNNEAIIGFVLKETPNDTIMKILDKYHVYFEESE